jgi:hypothetical protein
MFRYGSGGYPAESGIVEGVRLPFIRGTWYYVDPKSGNNLYSGENISEAVADIETAYGLCTDGAGDGIILLSRGSTTAADTTSYMKHSLAWTKSGITVVGVAAPVGMYGRARVANVEVATSSLTTCAQTASTITREAGSFITDGWVVGMTGKIVDSGSNNGSTFTVTEVAALTLTVSETLNVQSKAQTISTTLTSYCPEIILVSGHNNAFLNVNIGNWSSHALALGGVKVTGNRNYFGNCHMVGAGHATPGAVATAYDIQDEGQENVFERCIFGTDTVLRAAANANVVFDGGAWRSRFIDCDFISYSETAGHGAIKSYDATAMSGVHIFTRCRFIAWKPNGMGSLTSAFIGTKPNSGQILIDSCSLLGWAVWDSVGGNDTVWIANSHAVASGAGGIATAP